MIYRLLIHEDAQADIDELWRGSPTAAAAIAVLLDEIRGDQSLLDSLTDHDFGVHGDQPFHVNKWQSQWRRGNDLWRLKIWELETINVSYRVIYAYFVKDRTYYVLGVVPRSFDYEPEHPLSKRILSEYDKLAGKSI